MADWVRTMDEQSVLCRVKVATLDRAYRKARDAKDEVIQQCPDAASAVEAAFEAVGRLYDEAHAHSQGVPLSHAEFTKIGCSRLPEWAKVL